MSKHIIRDRDRKYTQQFCSIIDAEGIEFRPIPPRSPNMNPFAEAWVQRIKQECLDHFLVLGERHLRHLIREYLIHYHEERPHQGLGGMAPTEVRDGADYRIPSLESRPRWPVDGAAVRVKRVQLVVKFMAGRRHLPVVELTRAA